MNEGIVMDNSEMKIDVLKLTETIRSPVQNLANRLREDLGDNLLSLCVVGSALTADFNPKYSDINTVLLVRRRNHELLQLLAKYGPQMGRQRLRAPVLLTEEYIQRSLDVFGVEFLDFQLNHAVVLGPDPFSNLAVNKSDVRLQCERQLKSALIQLRQGYIRSLGKSKLVGQLLLACITELTAVMRALLWCRDQDRPREIIPAMEKTSKHFGFDAESIRPLFEAKRSHTVIPREQNESLFEHLYQIIDHLSRQVDQMQV